MITNGNKNLPKIAKIRGFELKGHCPTITLYIPPGSAGICLGSVHGFIGLNRRPRVRRPQTIPWRVLDRGKSKKTDPFPASERARSAKASAAAEAVSRGPRPLAAGFGDGSGVPNKAKTAEPLPVQPHDSSQEFNPRPAT